MGTIVAVHAFRSGSGKSTIASNLAVLLAAGGTRVGVVDINLRAPSIHLLFGVVDPALPSPGDYLASPLSVRQAVHDLSHLVAAPEAGQLYLIPLRVAREHAALLAAKGGAGDAALLSSALHLIVEELALDVLLVDTEPGFGDESLVALACADVLVDVLRIDKQDYGGTGVTLELARKLDFRQVLLVVNDVAPAFDEAAIRQRVAQVYGWEVVAMLPHTEELTALASADLFVLRYPHHELTRRLRQVALRLDEL